MINHFHKSSNFIDNYRLNFYVSNCMSKLGEKDSLSPMVLSDIYKQLIWDFSLNNIQNSIKDDIISKKFIWIID